MVNLIPFYDTVFYYNFIGLYLHTVGNGCCILWIQPLRFWDRGGVSRCYQQFGGICCLRILGRAHV